MKHNIEGIEAFAWQPQTPARQRVSSLYGACAQLSKLSSHSSGSLLRESSQVCTPRISTVLVRIDPTWCCTSRCGIFYPTQLCPIAC